MKALTQMTNSLESSFDTKLRMCRCLLRLVISTKEDIHTHWHNRLPIASSKRLIGNLFLCIAMSYISKISNLSYKFSYTIYCKSFEVEKSHSCRTNVLNVWLENIRGWMVACMARPIAQAISLEKFCGTDQSAKTASRMICNIQYI